jgi:hypothetical protein
MRGGWERAMGIFYLVFFLVIAVFVFVIARGIAEWVNNNNSPRLSVDARIVEKRVATHHHHGNGHHYHTHSYHITFEVQSGDRMELRVPREEFALLVEGDEGTLSFRGTRFLGFERNR